MSRVAATASGRVEHEDAQRTKRIRKGIIEAGNRLRAQHPWLERHQDAIGAAIFLVSFAGVVANAWAYAAGLVAWYVAIPVAAIWMSFLHELEHDLIHSLYFRGRIWNDLMLAGVWLARPSTISPWVRRRLHLHHHKVSGTESDLEERQITNGEPWGLRRLLMTGDNLLAVYLRPFATYKMLRAFANAQTDLSDRERLQLILVNVNGYFPIALVNYAIWHGFVLFHVGLFVFGLFGVTPEVPASIQSLVDASAFVVVTISAPNALRTFALHFVSSNMHYYGDVEEGNVVQQCQVWTSPWLLPLHLFCFNFAGTHAFHHFVVRDPFYIRQILAPGLYPLLRENGVRFNDFGTFRRANRLERVAA